MILDKQEILRIVYASQAWAAFQSGSHNRWLAAFRRHLTEIKGMFLPVKMSLKEVPTLIQISLCRKTNLAGKICYSFFPTI